MKNKVKYAGGRLARGTYGSMEGVRDDATINQRIDSKPTQEAHNCKQKNEKNS
jgi:hypothetical protein